MKFKVENIEACEPINSLLTMLHEKGFNINESKVSDYHFNELHFLMHKDNPGNDTADIKIENIICKEPHKFYCSCHWSAVIIDNF